MVSVIITAYNVEDYIKRAIDSVKSQTYSDIEIIVVEDCSSDSTLQILSETDDIRLIRHEVNLGAGAARQTGIDHAIGNFTLFLDADDWLEPNCIEQLVLTQDKYNSDLTGCNIRSVMGDSSNEEITPECVMEGVEKFDRIAGKIPFLNSILVRRDLWKKVKYCSRRFIEDSPVLYKLLFFANRLVYNGKVGYNYYQRDTSLCHSSSPYRKNLFTALAIIDVILFLNCHRNEGGADICNRLGLLKALLGTYRTMYANMVFSDDTDKYPDERKTVENFVKLLKVN